jgi:hypothetical protein
MADARSLPVAEIAILPGEGKLKARALGTPREILGTPPMCKG